jgi:predicted ATPase
LGGAVLIGGESGVGKSRLLEEIRIRALVEGFTVLNGAAIGRGRAPYQVWRTVIRSLVIDSDLSPAVLSPLQAIVADIEALLQAKLPKLEELDPEETQDRIIAAVERLFLAQKKPLLLILEDLHWEGVESYALLGRLVKLSADLPLLILGSYRDDESPHLPDLFPQMGLLRLQRLDPAQIAALSVAMLGDGGRNPQLQDLLQRETEGNVFFLVEIVRALAEEAGDLRHIAAMELPQHVFAGGIIKIIQRRLERVPNRYQPLLRLAAVAGRYLDLRLLQSIAPGSDVQDWLTLCLNAAVLDTQDGQWRFAHDKLREGVLSWLPKNQVGKLHAQVATGIENLYADTPQYAQYIPALAEHWSVAGVADKASRFSRLAGSQALESGAYDQAAPLLEAALVHLPDTGESEMLKHRAALVRQIGLAYLGMNRAEEAKTRFQQSLKHCQDAGYKWGTAQALSDLGNSLYALKSFKESYGAYLDSLQIAKETRAKDLAPNGIIGVARLLMQAKRYAEATELAAFIEEYASFAKTDRQTVMRAQEVLEQAGQALSPQDFEAAKTRGKAKKLTEVMDELLVA